MLINNPIFALGSAFLLFFENAVAECPASCSNKSCASVRIGGSSLTKAFVEASVVELAQEAAAYCVAFSVYDNSTSGYSLKRLIGTHSPIKDVVFTGRVATEDDYVNSGCDAEDFSDTCCEEAIPGPFAGAGFQLGVDSIHFYVQSGDHPVAGQDVTGSLLQTIVDTYFTNDPITWGQAFPSVTDLGALEDIPVVLIMGNPGTGTRASVEELTGVTFTGIPGVGGSGAQQNAVANDAQNLGFFSLTQIFPLAGVELVFGEGTFLSYESKTYLDSEYALKRPFRIHINAPNSECSTNHDVCQGIKLLIKHLIREDTTINFVENQIESLNDDTRDAQMPVINTLCNPSGQT
jgi:hypothetical protein